MSLPNRKQLTIYWLLLKVTLTTASVFLESLLLRGVVMQGEIPVPCECSYKRRRRG